MAHESLNLATSSLLWIGVQLLGYASVGAYDVLSNSDRKMALRMLENVWIDCEEASDLRYYTILI